MLVSSTRAAELAKALYDAEKASTTIDKISVTHPDLDGDEAYAVQGAYAELRRADGAKLIGRKIGLTSKAMQELFGISTPDYGHIFDDMVVPNGATVPMTELIQPMVEVEVCFLLGRDLAGPGVTRDDVMEATEAVLPCIEIIDSRIVDWAFTFVDTVSDNGSSARCVFSDERVKPGDVDLTAVKVELHQNGEFVNGGVGSDVMGHPAEGIVWLANSIGTYGHTLRAGDFVLSGAIAKAVPAKAGDTFEARVSDLGTVECAFR